METTISYESEDGKVFEVTRTVEVRQSRKEISTNLLMNKIRKTEQYLANINKRLEIINKLEVNEDGKWKLGKTKKPY